MCFINCENVKLIRSIFSNSIKMEHIFVQLSFVAKYPNSEKSNKQRKMKTIALTHLVFSRFDLFDPRIAVL